MNKALLITSGFVFGLCGVSLSVGAQVLSAPVVVFCEFASLPPTEALDRLAESYQGLLEFGGEAMAREYTTLESFFEAVPNGDQRSTALNESLAKLGDWVMLEAEDLGLTHEVILARLREVVREHARTTIEEQEQVEDTREESRQIIPTSQVFEPHPGFDHLSFLGNGGHLMTSDHSSALFLWRMDDLSTPVDQFSPPQALLGNWFYPTFFDIPNTGRVAVFYEKSGWIQVWDWRNHRLEVEVEVPAEVRVPVFGVSPDGNWIAGVVLVGPKLVSKVYFLNLKTSELTWIETGETAADSEEFRRLLWAPDGSRVVLVSETSMRSPSYFRVYDVNDLRPSPRHSMPEKYSEIDGFGLDRDHLVLLNKSDNRLVEVRLEAEGSGWKLLDSWGTRGSFGRVDVWRKRRLFGERAGTQVVIRRQAGEFLTLQQKEGEPSFLMVYDRTGKREAIPLRAQAALAGDMILSANEKLLAIVYYDGPILFVDLEHRQVVAAVNSQFQQNFVMSMSQDGRFFSLRDAEVENRLHIWSLERLRDQ